MFTREDLASYELKESDIMFLHPILSGGSERQLEKLTFGIDLSNFDAG